MHPLAERVGELIRAQNFFPGNCGIIVAVSGGIDSMALLHLLAVPAIGLRERLVIAHYKHQLRGVESEDDAAFVAQIANRLGFPFESDAGDTRQFADETGAGIEAAARELRHSFFGRLAKRLKAVVALAHHADDQVETFFLRLLRGAGDRGLAGMKPIAPSPTDPGVTLFRPLLGIRRDDIAAFVAEEGIEFRNDTTNKETRFLRNRIRHKLLPRLTEQFGSSVSRQVLKTMQLAGDAADCIDHLAADWSGQPPFGQLSVAVQRQVLRRQLFGLGDEPTFDLVESLRLKAGRIIEVSSGRRLQRNAAGKVDVAVDEPEFLLAKREVSLSGKEGETEFGGLKIQWERLSGGFDKWRELGQMNNREVFNAASIGQSITLRHWQPGDRYKPIGQAGTTKLQDLFVNQKIPKPERRGLVVAEDANGQLFWVQKLRIADSGKVTGSTRELLLLSW